MIYKIWNKVKKYPYTTFYLTVPTLSALLLKPYFLIFCLLSIPFYKYDRLIARYRR